MLKKLIFSRKFLLSLIIISCGSVFLGLRWLTGGEWVTAASIVIGAYTASNVVQKYVQKNPNEDGED